MPLPRVCPIVVKEFGHHSWFMFSFSDLIRRSCRAGEVRSCPPGAFLVRLFFLVLLRNYADAETRSYAFGMRVAKGCRVFLEPFRTGPSDQRELMLR